MRTLGPFAATNSLHFQTAQDTPLIDQSHDHLPADIQQTSTQDSRRWLTHHWQIVLWTFAFMIPSSHRPVLVPMSYIKCYWVPARSFQGSQKCHLLSTFEGWSLAEVQPSTGGSEVYLGIRKAFPLVLRDLANMLIFCLSGFPCRHRLVFRIAKIISFELLHCTSVRLSHMDE